MSNKADSVPLDEGGFLTARQVRECLQLGERTFRRMVSAGKFPKPIELGRTLKRWRRAEVEEFRGKLREGNCGKK